MIGLALVAMVAVLGESAKAQIDASDANLEAELVLDTTQFTGFSPEVVDRVESLPEVRSAVGFHFGRIPINGQRERVIGMNGTGLADAFDLQLEPGSTSVLDTDGILVAREEASQFGWAVGDTVSLSFPLGERAVRVVGVYGAEDISFGSPIFVSRELFRTSVPEADLDYRAYVSVAPGVPVREAKAAVEREIGRDFPNLEVLTQDEARDAEAELVDQFLGVLVALLFLSEAIAVLGIVNTLALSVHERTHEIGMLPRHRHDPPATAPVGAVGVGDHRRHRRDGRSRARAGVGMGVRLRARDRSALPAERAARTHRAARGPLARGRRDRRGDPRLARRRASRSSMPSGASESVPPCRRDRLARRGLAPPGWGRRARTSVGAFVAAFEEIRHGPLDHHPPHPPR